jgi:hypothetical protein
MFDKKFEDRMRLWSEFRSTLETSNDPYSSVIEFYKRAPLVSIQADPWDQKTWPDPWELLYDNQYCNFCKLLGICYSLQLTDRFKDTVFKIHICTNAEDSEVKYLLYVDDFVIGYDMERTVYKNEIPENIFVETVYIMPSLQ